MWSPFALSMWVSAWAGILALVSGVGVAWLLAKRRFGGKGLLEGVILLPLVLPPTVLGYYLLVALGARGLGPWTEALLGLQFVFNWQGIVIAAAISALPLVVQTARAGFAQVSREIEDAARVDGCTELQLLWLIDLPIAWRSIVAGGLLGYLRSLGEFGASLMVAGNIPGRTQTLSMAIYDAVQMNDLARAGGLTALLSGIAFGVLYVALYLNRRAA